MEGKIQPNTKSDIPITNLDILPTIMNYAGYSDQLEIDGVNLCKVLEEKITVLERPLFWHFPIYLQAYKKKRSENRDPLFRTRPGSVVRLGDWKLHYYFENNEIELYNLAEDIVEKNNLSEEEPEKTKELLSLLRQWWSDTEAPIPTELNPEYKVQ